VTNASLMGQLERRLIETDAHARDLYERLRNLETVHLTTLVRLHGMLEDGAVQSVVAWLDEAVETLAAQEVDRMLEIAAHDPLWDGIGVQVFAAADD
jgi:hypothetical protein